jgi:ribosome-associated heat shock protein Hsp15
MMEHKSQLFFEIAPQEENLQPALVTFDDESVDENGEKVLKVRLDKWLWAARFFKTRPLARAAIELGKILYNGQKTTPSKEIELGAMITLKQGRNRKVVSIRGLSTRRRNLEEGSALYEEIESVYTDFFDETEENVKSKRPVRFLRRNMHHDTANQFKNHEAKE